MHISSCCVVQVKYALVMCIVHCSVLIMMHTRSAMQLAVEIHVHRSSRGRCRVDVQSTWSGSPTDLKVGRATRLQRAPTGRRWDSCRQCHSRRFKPMQCDNAVSVCTSCFCTASIWTHVSMFPQSVQSCLHCWWHSYTKVGKILIKLKMRKINILSYLCQSRSKFEINASLDVKFVARLVFLLLTNCCFLRQRFEARSQWSFKPRVLLTWNTFWDLSLTHFKGWFVLQVVSTNTFVANKFPSVWTNLQKHPALQRCKPQGGIALPF